MYLSTIKHKRLYPWTTQILLAWDKLTNKWPCIVHSSIQNNVSEMPIILTAGIHHYRQRLYWSTLSHYEGESDVRVDSLVPPEPEYHSAHINALLTFIIAALRDEILLKDHTGLIMTTNLKSLISSPKKLPCFARNLIVSKRT